LKPTSFLSSSIEESQKGHDSHQNKAENRADYDFVPYCAASDYKSNSAYKFFCPLANHSSILLKAAGVRSDILGLAPWGAASMWGVAQLVMRHVEKRYVQSPSISVRRFTGLAAAFSPDLSFCCAEDVSL